MNSRPTKDQYFLEIAKLAAARATCLRRSVGCVLVDATGHLLSVGYNGTASGMPHCNEKQATGLSFPHACRDYDRPTGLDQCEAVHAEQNALLQCTDPRQIYTAYVTLSPCKACLKLLLNTGCKRIVFLKEHDDPEPKLLWEKLGRLWVHYVL